MCTYYTFKKCGKRREKTLSKPVAIIKITKRLTLKAILRIQKLKTFAQISGVERHNSRQNPPENADHGKEDIQLFGEESVVDKIKSILASYGINPRKNAVLAVEYVLTASPEAFQEPSIDLENWYNSNIVFLKKKHGPGLVSVWLHLSESTPHLHALVTPIRKKPDGSVKLCARDFFGGRQKLSSLQTQYAKAMAKFGLERGQEKSTAKHKDIKVFYKELNQRVENSKKDIQRVLRENTTPSLLTYKSSHKKLKKSLRNLKYAHAKAKELEVENSDLRQQLNRTLVDLKRTKHELIRFKKALGDYPLDFIQRILGAIGKFIINFKVNPTNLEVRNCFDDFMPHCASARNEEWAHLSQKLEELTTLELTKNNNYKR